MSNATAWLQLLRMPNIFTAMADVLLGLLVTGLWQTDGLAAVLLVGASAAMYEAGIVMNDICDRSIDARERRHRPIPSGHISLQSARALCGVLVVAAIIAATAASLLMVRMYPLLIVLLLGLAIVIYNLGGKRGPAGPALLGLCRFLNVALGFSAAPNLVPAALAPASIVGLYVAGFSVWAAAEVTGTSRSRTRVGWMLINLALAGAVALAILTGADVPALAASIAFLVLIDAAVRRATRQRTPAAIAATVGMCIGMIILLDAVLAATLSDLWNALTIAVLYVPHVFLAKSIYRT
jgi:4-hydroxybenzoate polyprenyltransferase